MTTEPSLLAVVVGGVDYGDADRIVRVLSAEEGKDAVMARRARSSTRRFAGALDVGTTVVLHRRRGRGSLALLVGVDVVVAVDRARTDIDRLAMLAYGCEVCAALAPEAHPAPRLFKLLQTWLDLLEGADVPGHASRVALETKALTFAGLTPSLVACARCGEPLDDPAMWDPESGGGIHARCGGGGRVAVASLARAEALRRTPLADTTRGDVPADVRWAVSDFARHHLGRDLRSRGLLEDLARADPDGIG